MFKIVKKHDPKREKFGMTPNDLKLFVAECERVGVDMDEPLTGCTVSFGARLKKLEAGS